VDGIVDRITGVVRLKKGGQALPVGGEEELLEGERRQVPSSSFAAEGLNSRL